MIAPARRTALDALRDVEEGATDITIGTLRWRARIDHLLAGASSRPLDALDAGALHALRLSAYQLLHLDRVPPSAIVNDGVGLARATAGAGAAGFVNAVLRRLADPARRPPLPARPGPSGRMADWVAYLAVTWSHPAWLVRRWLIALGTEATEVRLRYNQTPAQATVRAVAWRNGRDDLRAKLLEEQVETAPTRYAAGGLQVVGGNPLSTRAAREGALVVQDEGSQLVAAYADAASARCVLDVCAAPGGKTTAMAEACGAAALVVAGDVRKRRVRLLRDTVRAIGRDAIRIVAHDALRGLPYRPAFDLVVVDAPCSGLGTLRRDPDVKWRRRESELAEFAGRQRQMLVESARVVAAGGRLVYATCSSEPEENGEVARWFLGAHRDFTSASPPPAFLQAPLSELLGADGTLQTSPERHGLDVFFAAGFVRRG
ncbi:MAG: hypothetical protein MUF60_11265 [Vicinamibacterales bacterium]|nr:hypothetical protein [Vicinamibacterales bacterium]